MIFYFVTTSKAKCYISNTPIMFTFTSMGYYLKPNMFSISLIVFNEILSILKIITGVDSNTSSLAFFNIGSNTSLSIFPWCWLQNLKIAFSNIGSNTYSAIFFNIDSHTSTSISVFSTFLSICFFLKKSCSYKRS